MNLTDLVKSNESSIVDVRTTEEFASYRIESSINIPLNLLPENITGEIKSVFISFNNKSVPIFPEPIIPALIIF